MVGIGPFITIPLFIKAMGGPHALVAWPIAAVLVLCDGLVWSELGAAMPGSGGTYHFLREIFGRYRWGRLLPFLFIWQFLVTGTMEMASGYIGAIPYVQYIFDPSQVKPPDGDATAETPDDAATPAPGPQISWTARAIAAGCSIIIAVALCRRIQFVGWFGVVLCGGTMLTVLGVIAAGLTHFDASLLTFPPNAFALNASFAFGLASAMRIAVYDYLGYYNVCHLGDEVREPGRTIPRAVIVSVLIIAATYLTMNLSIIAVVPWQRAMNSTVVASDFMERLFGRPFAVAFTWLILWTVAACMFAITLGYSRIPYAAARNGDFFSVFAKVHARDRFPTVALAAISALTAFFCFFSLDLVVNSAVTIRIAVQFIGQIVALHVVRTTRPDVKLPFRMWLYPVPSLLALVGWLFVLFMPDPDLAWRPLLLALGVNLSGCVAFVLWHSATRTT